MKLRNCDLRFAAVVKDAVIRDRPEKLWTEARNEQTIPESLFRLYTAAGYLSLDRAPPFLDDEDRVLFSYFGTLLNGLRDSLGESMELLDEVRSLEDQVWSPITRKGDRKASTKQRRAMRYLLLNLSCSLDVLAELIALLFTNDVSTFKLGRASCSNLVQWVERPLEPQASPLVTASYHFLERLHETIQPLMIDDGPEKDWYRLFLMYRNKLSHLGGSTLVDFRLHDETGQFYAFLPREWPFTWQAHVSFSQYADVDIPRGRSNLVDTITQSCMHIDIVEYSQGLVGRIRKIHDEAIGVLVDAYESLSSFPLNTAALAALRNQSQVYDFTEFVVDAS